MKHLVLILFLISSNAAFAQEESADCAAVLAAPPFVDMLTRNEGNDFHELSTRNAGRALVGLECSVDELTKFFEDAGWEFRGFEEKSWVGPLGGSGGIPEYFSDTTADYCLKRPTLFGRFFSCRPIATILFYKGRISHLIVYMSK